MDNQEVEEYYRKLIRTGTFTFALMVLLTTFNFGGIWLLWYSFSLILFTILVVFIIVMNAYRR